MPEDRSCVLPPFLASTCVLANQTGELLSAELWCKPAHLRRDLALREGLAAKQVCTSSC